MTPQEQSAIDRVFGRIHVRTSTGFSPVNPLPTAPAQKPDTKKVLPQQVVVAKEAPKQEDAPVLRKLKSTFPEAPVVPTKSRPAD